MAIILNCTAAAAAPLKDAKAKAAAPNLKRLVATEMLAFSSFCTGGKQVVVVVVVHKKNNNNNSNMIIEINAQV